MQPVLASLCYFSTLLLYQLMFRYTDPEVSYVVVIQTKKNIVDSFEPEKFEIKI